MPVEKYVSYDSEVDALYDVQRLAKQEQIRRHCKNETEMEAYVFYVISPEIIELQADECGHFRILTDSDVSEIYNLAKPMTPIHIYDIRPATREEAKGIENHPDIVGKVELIK